MQAGAFGEIMAIFGYLLLIFNNFVAIIIFGTVTVNKFLGSHNNTIAPNNQEWWTINLRFLKSVDYEDP